MKIATYNTTNTEPPTANIIALIIKPIVTPIVAPVKYAIPLSKDHATEINIPNWTNGDKVLKFPQAHCHAALSPIHVPTDTIKSTKNLSSHTKNTVSNQKAKDSQYSKLVALIQFVTSSNIAKSFKNKDLLTYKPSTPLYGKQGFLRLFTIIQAFFSPFLTHVIEGTTHMFFSTQNLKTIALFGFFLLAVTSLSNPALAQDEGASAIIEMGNWAIKNLFLVVSILASFFLVGFGALCMFKWRNIQLGIGLLIFAAVVALGPVAKAKIMDGNMDAFLVEDSQ